MLNADLWGRVDELLQARIADQITFKKVKGHAKLRDVALGRITMEDRFGNYGADKLATAGA